jgi:RNA polymerase sigma factor (sigma-70 family)
VPRASEKNFKNYCLISHSSAINSQMPEVNDMELLRDYSRRGSEEAFAGLVRRHINLVYSAALRHVGIAAHAEEITQAVFVILARKAASLRPETILDAWLYETTRLTALSFLRGERRRQGREQEAYMQSTLPESTDVSVWNQLAPLLDEAMAQLGKKDREAVVLRFFKEKNLVEVAAAMKITEAAAQSRVHRALEKLRRYFSKRGVSSTTAIIAGAISANSVQAAPVALAKSVTAVAIAKGAAVGSSTLTLIKGALKIMAWTKAKTAIVAGAVVILAATSTTVIGIKLARAHRPAAERTDILSPLSENLTAEIQPTGTILFRAAVEETNATGQISESTDSFNGADTISRVVDESGQPMKFTKLPGGHSPGAHSYLITLPKPVPPGGRIYYTVDGAITRKIKPIPAGEYQVGYTDSVANVTDMRYIETWRLPVGATLLEKARGMEATTNAGQIELRSDQRVPPKGTISISFRYRLPAKTN